MHVACVIGTRPEAIKMAPVIQELSGREGVRVSVIVTSQHRHIVLPVLSLFGVVEFTDLDVMVCGQTLSHLTARLFERLSTAVDELNPDVIVAQGDTTTVFVASVVAFYKKVMFAHLEAGLRTGSLDEPFPEEFNRVVSDLVAQMHFAPTERAKTALLREGIPERRIFLTGNTVIDALRCILRRNPTFDNHVVEGRRFILVTLHRRESFGEPMRNVMEAIKEVVYANPDVAVLFPVHPNPNVRELSAAILQNIPRVHLVEPLDYPELVAAMRDCYFVVTDSGGIQEEAPALGKPVLVARNTTERPEAIDSGCAALIGTDKTKVIDSIQHLLHDTNVYRVMSTGGSPYGDGRAAVRVVDALQQFRKSGVLEDVRTLS